jgi:serine/threonine protein kinase
MSLMKTANAPIANRYKIVRELGGGGMKRVYLAEDLHLNRNCALAQMIDSFSNDAQRRAAVSAFEREADLLAKLENIHIPQIYDRFSENQNHFLVMEYVPGRTLEQRLIDSGEMDEAFVVDVTRQILDALVYLHELNPPIIYRDMKPSNVILRGGKGTNTVKLIDFGIARHFKSKVKVTSIGTQGYAPPEQYRGKPEPRSDLYALAATLHQLLTGRDPTSGEPFSFPPLSTLRPSCNPILATLIDEALSYSIEKRPASAFEFKRRLAAVATTGFASPATAAMVDDRRVATDPTVVLSHSRHSLEPDSNRASVRAPVKMASRLANKASFLLEQGKTAEAIDAYTEALSYDRFCREAWEGRGELHLKLEHNREAITDLTEAETLNFKPETLDFKRKASQEWWNRYVRYHRQRALAHLYLNEYREAVTEYTFLPNGSWIGKEYYKEYYNRGLAHIGLQCYRPAIDDFTRALAGLTTRYVHNPADAMRVRYMRALAHKRLGSSYYSWRSEYRADYHSLSKKAQAALDRDERPEPWR